MVQRLGWTPCRHRVVDLAVYLGPAYLVNRVGCTRYVANFAEEYCCTTLRKLAIDCSTDQRTDAHRHALAHGGRHVCSEEKAAGSLPTLDALGAHLQQGANQRAHVVQKLRLVKANLAHWYM